MKEFICFVDILRFRHSNSDDDANRENNSSKVHYILSTGIQPDAQGQFFDVYDRDYFNRHAIHCIHT